MIFKYVYRYLGDVHRCILKEEDVPDELSKDNLNVKYGMYHFLRKTHESNEKVSTDNKGNGLEIYKTVIPCQPNKDLYQNEDGSWNMKKIRDVFVAFLCSFKKRNPANYFHV